MLCFKIQPVTIVGFEGPYIFFLYRWHGHVHRNICRRGYFLQKNVQIKASFKRATENWGGVGWDAQDCWHQTVRLTGIIAHPCQQATQELLTIFICRQKTIICSSRVKCSTLSILCYNQGADYSKWFFRHSLNGKILGKKAWSTDLHKKFNWFFSTTFLPRKVKQVVQSTTQSREIIPRGWTQKAFYNLGQINKLALMHEDLLWLRNDQGSISLFTRS
jgi:hypothetical protein